MEKPEYAMQFQTHGDVPVGQCVVDDLSGQITAIMSVGGFVEGPTSLTPVETAKEYGSPADQVCRALMIEDVSDDPVHMHVREEDIRHFFELVDDYKGEKRLTHLRFSFVHRSLHITVLNINRDAVPPRIDRLGSIIITELFKG